MTPLERTRESCIIFPYGILYGLVRTVVIIYGYVSIISIILSLLAVMSHAVLYAVERLSEALC
jgi:hypothetical protein